MQFSDRVAAGGLFILAGCLPAGTWIIFLFAGNSGSLTWVRSLEFALSAENEIRWFFVTLAVSSVFSFAAGAFLLLKPLSRVVLKVLLVGGIAQLLVYLA